MTEVGSHAQLLARGGRYRRLVTAAEAGASDWMEGVNEGDNDGLDTGQALVLGGVRG